MMFGHLDGVQVGGGRERRRGASAVAAPAPHSEQVQRVGHELGHGVLVRLGLLVRQEPVLVPRDDERLVSVPGLALAPDQHGHVQLNVLKTTSDQAGSDQIKPEELR